jgi:hypothetical protein
MVETVTESAGKVNNNSEACRVSNKVGMGSEDGAMEQDDGFGVLVRSLAEVVNVPIGAEAADDGGAGWSVKGMTLGADGDLAVVADADAGLLDHPRSLYLEWCKDRSLRMKKFWS